MSWWARVCTITNHTNWEQRNYAENMFLDGKVNVTLSGKQCFHPFHYTTVLCRSITASNSTELQLKISEISTNWVHHATPHSISIPFDSIELPNVQNESYFQFTANRSGLFIPCQFSSPKWFELWESLSRSTMRLNWNDVVRESSSPSKNRRKKLGIDQFFFEKMTTERIVRLDSGIYIEMRHLCLNFQCRFRLFVYCFHSQNPTGSFHFEHLKDLFSFFHHLTTSTSFRSSFSVFLCVLSNSQNWFVLLLVWCELR